MPAVITQILVKRRSLYIILPTFIGSVIASAGPYRTGFIKTATGSFHLAYLYLAGSLGAAGVLMLTLKKR